MVEAQIARGKRQRLGRHAIHGGARTGPHGRNLVEGEPARLQGVVGRRPLAGDPATENGDEHEVMAEHIAVGAIDHVERRKGDAGLHCYACLFGDFALRGRRDRLAGLDAPAGKAPAAAIRRIGTADEENSAVAHDHGDGGRNGTDGIVVGHRDDYARIDGCRARLLPPDLRRGRFFRIYKAPGLRNSPRGEFSPSGSRSSIMTTLSQTHPTLIGTLWPARSNAVLRWIVLMLAGTLFVAVSAHIEVPLYPVPITMQTFAVLVVGMVYGSRLGAATLVLYLVEGLGGLPVFATGGALGPSFGYIVGFVLAAGVVGWLAERGWDRSVVRTAIAMLIGNIVIYVPGLAVLAGFVGIGKVLEYGLIPFLVGDAVKLLLAACLLPLVWQAVGKRRA